MCLIVVFWGPRLAESHHHNSGDMATEARRGPGDTITDAHMIEPAQTIHDVKNSQFHFIKLNIMDISFKRYHYTRSLNCQVRSCSVLLVVRSESNPESQAVQPELSPS